MNILWLTLILVSLIVGAINGRLSDVTKAAFDMSQTAVTIAIGLVGVMSLWLGLMKIAEDSGLVQLLSRLLKPVSRLLFPRIPDGHPAVAAMLLNLSANWLGLSNAATPLGLKAMEELQTLNDDKETATDEMVLFLSLNTASITLVPATILGVRLSLNSTNPHEIIGPTILSSLLGTVFAVFVTVFLAKLPRFKKKNLVILNEVKNLPATQEILRSAQDDKNQ